MFLWTFYPVISNLVVAALALLGGRVFFATGTIPEGVLLMFVCGGIAANAFAFFSREVGPGSALVIMLCQGLALVLLYAAFYHGSDLAFAEGAPNGLEIPDAIYFSVVTWTTLGYGDLSPPVELRLLAASQAVLGLIFFGLFVGVAVNVINRYIK